VDKIATNVGTKLIFCVILLVITAVSAALIPALYFFSDMLEQEQERAAMQGVEGLHNIIDEYKAEAVHYSAVFSRHPELVTALENKDRSELLRLLRRMQEDSGVDFITVTDDRGIVVMRTHEPRQGDSLADLVDVKAALAGAVQAVVEPGTVVKLGIRAGAPVRNEQGKIVGVVSLGYDATKDEIVDRVKQLFHTEATLFLGDERVSTTIIKDGRRVVGTKLNEPIATAVLREGKTHLGRAEILGTDYMTAYLPVMGADNRPVGVLFAGESLADFLAARNKTIMIVGFIILCFLTGVIFVTTNRLHREMADAKLALEQMVLSRTEELRKSNCFTELILENIPNAIFIKDVVNLQYVRVNRATEELLAYSRDELIGKSDDELFHKTEADSFALSDRKALRTGKLINIPEEKVSIRNNGIKWLHTKKIPIYGGKIDNLISLYAIGVFVSFTIAQVSMVVHWRREKGAGWQLRALLNGLGGVTTGIVVAVITVTKFMYGAWMVLIFIPIMVTIFKRIRSHYNTMAEQLHLPEECYAEGSAHFPQGKHLVIVPVASPTRIVYDTIKYAKLIGDNIIAVHVASDDESELRVRQKWQCWDPGVQLVVLRSPYRLLMRPLIHFIEKKQREKGPDDFITVVIPEFETKKWWHRLLHNQTGWFLHTTLVLKENIAVTTVPFHLKQ